ncbi:hypothetical protein Ciccas_011607, partial [Cichlidogyrus casuarinus]
MEALQQMEHMIRMVEAKSSDSLQKLRSILGAEVKARISSTDEFHIRLRYLDERVATLSATIHAAISGLDEKQNRVSTTLKHNYEADNKNLQNEFGRRLMDVNTRLERLQARFDNMDNDLEIKVPKIVDKVNVEMNDRVGNFYEWQLRMDKQVAKIYSSEDELRQLVRGLQNSMEQLKYQEMRRIDTESQLR